MTKRMKKIRFDNNYEWTDQLAEDQWENEKITLTMTPQRLQKVITYLYNFNDMMLDDTDHDEADRLQKVLDESIAKQMAFRNFCEKAKEQLDISDTSHAKRLLKIKKNKEIFDLMIEVSREEIGLS